jgi:hypothetical protein
LRYCACSFGAAFYFTWRKARHNKLPVWDLQQKTHDQYADPLVQAVFIIAMYQYNEWIFIAPPALSFMLALVNASKIHLQTLNILDYQILVGLVNTQFVGMDCIFGRGLVLHIIYGFVMWWKYERNG